jgi:Flp pilus assembly protein TadD
MLAGAVSLRGARMRRLVLALPLLAFLLSIASPPAAAQVRTRIFLPDGSPLMEMIEVELHSDSGIQPVRYTYTDSKGWFYFSHIKQGRYKIIVPSDEKNFATTTQDFIVHGTGNTLVNIHLQPLVEVRESTKAPGVSVQELQHEPPPRARRAYEAGVQAFQQNQIELARAKFQEAIGIDPQYVSAYNELAVVEMSQKRYPEAETLLRKAVEIDPNSPHAQSNLGVSLNHQGRFADAVTPLRKALQLRPRWVAPKVYLGIALVETGELDGAESLLEHGTTATGVEEALAYLYLGKLYAVRGEREKAIAAWENYLRRDPDSMNAINVREMLAQLRTIGSKRP